MQKYLLFLLIGLFSLTGNAQNKIDKVYLKNRSILRGTIIENSDSMVRIIVVGGSVWTIPSSYVAGTGKGKPDKQPFQTINTEKTMIKERGYNLITNIGVYFPFSGEKSSYFHCSAIHSYSILPNLSIGLGLGIDRDVRSYYPIFADARVYVNRKKFAPFISVSYGKAFAWDKTVYFMWRDLNNYGGPYFCTSLGIEFPWSEKLSFLLAIEYKYQKNTYKSLPDTQYFELIEEINRFGLKLGFLFH